MPEHCSLNGSASIVTRSRVLFMLMLLKVLLLEGRAHGDAAAEYLQPHLKLTAQEAHWAKQRDQLGPAQRQPQEAAVPIANAMNRQMHLRVQGSCEAPNESSLAFVGSGHQLRNPSHVPMWCRNSSMQSMNLLVWC